MDTSVLLCPGPLEPPSAVLESSSALGCMGVISVLLSGVENICREFSLPVCAEATAVPGVKLRLLSTTLNSSNGLSAKSLISIFTEMAEADRKPSEPLRKSSGFSTARTTLTERPTSRLLSIEREHEAHLTQAYDRLHLSDNAHELEVQTLKAQVAALRQDLAVTQSANARELSQLRSQLQGRVEAEQKLREAEVLSGNSQLREKQQLWAREADLAAELRRELLSLKAKRADETGRILGEQRRGTQELEVMRQQRLARLQHEVDRARAENARAAEQQQRLTALQRQEQQNQLSLLNTELAERESRARRLETDVQRLRLELQDVTEQGEQETQRLRHSLTELRHVAELQDRDLSSLEGSRQQARLDAREMSAEVRRLEQERKRLDSENHLLRSNSGKLGKIVYGRTRVTS